MPPQGGQCPYCQLIDNPDQLMIVDETENFYAWLEIQPRARGHTQVVPKEHIGSVYDLEFDEYMEMQRLVRRVMERAKEGLGADGVSVTMNVNEAAGQMLPHIYVSVFPRFEGEENAGTPTGAIFPQREELQEQLQGIQGDMDSVSVEFEQESHDAHEESQKYKTESNSSTGGMGSMLESGPLSGSPGSSSKSNEEEKSSRESNEEEPEKSGSNEGENEDEVELELRSEGEIFQKLISRYGGIDQMIESEEFRKIIENSSFFVTRKNNYSGGGVSWR